MHFERCAQAQVLLDAYLQAVARREAAAASAPDSGTYLSDVKVAQDMVRECRAFYWNHVQKHGCRTNGEDNHAH